MQSPILVDLKSLFQITLNISSFNTILPLSSKLFQRLKLNKAELVDRGGRKKSGERGLKSEKDRERNDRNFKRNRGRETKNH